MKNATDDFSKISIPKADLIFANFSLFFVKINFDLLMENIQENINKNGFFVGNCLGEDDERKKIIYLISFLFYVITKLDAHVLQPYKFLQYFLRFHAPNYLQYHDFQMYSNFHQLKS